jgi:hypothetical protein
VRNILKKQKKMTPIRKCNMNAIRKILIYGCFLKKISSYTNKIDNFVSNDDDHKNQWFQGTRGGFCAIFVKKGIKISIYKKNEKMLVSFIH